MSDYLTFGELKIGERFISVPQPGDNSGHGGYKLPSYIFTKTEAVDGNNSIRQKDGVRTHNQDSMPIIKVE